jgi:hypothetical protein
MAGGKLTASAHFGPAWAEVVFGADGIVYFDPFRFEVEVYASISAGVTIDFWIGEVTISITLGASIMVAGPKFHGVATFDVGPIGLTVSFGDSNQSQKQYIPWDQFVRKYLEEASPGVARVLTAIPGKGALPTGTGAGGTEKGTADGSAEKPFEVISEFEITVTTTIPTQTMSIGGAADTDHPPSSVIGVAPVGVGAANTRLVLNLKDAANAEHLGALIADINEGGAFPVGVWGPPQPDDDRKIPSGDVIQAVDSVRFEAVAKLQGTLPGEVKYNQVETGTRKPLPFVSIEASRAAFLAAAHDLSNLLPAASGGPATFAVAKPWLAKGGNSATALAAVQRERKAPPRLGSLTQDLAANETPTPQVAFPSPAKRPPIDYVVHSPRAIAVLTSPAMPERAQVRTTVKDPPIKQVTVPPTIAQVQAELPLALAAKLVRTAAPAVSQQTTMVAAGAIPLTRVARGAVAAVAARGAFADAKARLDTLTAGLAGAAGVAAAEPDAQEIRAGEVVVLQLPNAKRDVKRAAPRPLLMVTGPARVAAFSHGGEVLFDGPGTPNGVVIPIGTERVAVLALGDPAVGGGLLGWHSGQEVAYVGWSSALVAGAVVRAEGASVRSTRQRFRAGWMHAADLVEGTTIVVTRFAHPVHTVAIFIDDPVSSEAARGLSLALEGADRAAGPDGQPVAPTVVVAGNRSVLIYPIKPMQTPAGLPGPITVSVASQDGWHVAGVMASTEPAATMADRVTRNGRDALVQPLVSGHGASVQLQWAPPAAPPSTGSGPTQAGSPPPAAKSETVKPRKKRKP